MAYQSLCKIYRKSATNCRRSYTPALGGKDGTQTTRVKRCHGIVSFIATARDIKFAAVRLYQDEILSMAAILDYLSMSRSTFYRLYALGLATVRHRNGTRGRPRILHFYDVDTSSGLSDIVRTGFPTFL